MQGRNGQKNGLEVVVAVRAFAYDIETQVDFGVRVNCHTVSMNERCTLLKTIIPMVSSTTIKAAL